MAVTAHAVVALPFVPHCRCIRSPRAAPVEAATDGIYRIAIV